MVVTLTARDAAKASASLAVAVGVSGWPHIDIQAEQDVGQDRGGPVVGGEALQPVGVERRHVR